jgi:hypothetical protein
MEAQPILESWKEISAYLKRSVRTCRRWESSLGLPVHRLDGTPSARVFAYPEEIDRWMAEKLHKNELESKAPGGSHRLRKILLLASAAVVIILAASVIFARLVFPPRSASNPF